MAVDVSPAAWISGYTLDESGNLVIPRASLGLSAEHANASTGDIREIARAISKTLYDAQQDLAAADRPANMTLLRTVPTPIDADSMSVDYRQRFIVGVTEGDVDPEPVEGN